MPLGASTLALLTHRDLISLFCVETADRSGKVKTFDRAHETSAIVEGFAPRRCGCQEDCRCKKPRLDGGLEAECFWFFGSLGGVGARKFRFFCMWRKSRYIIQGFAE